MNRWSYRKADRSRNARASGSDKSPSSRAVYPWHMRFRLAVLATAALVVVAPSPALAQSPAGYRAQLNRQCRTFTPKFKRVERDIEKAAKAKDLKGVAHALGRGLALNLAQDTYIEGVPVPAAMRTRMVPILRLLRTLDRHARLALRNATKGDGRGFMAAVNEVDRIVPTLNKRLDRVGLRDCGSNQA
jgi:hypothetical protein